MPNAIVIAIVAIFILLGAGLGLAYARSWWPFSDNENATTKPTTPTKPKPTTTVEQRASVFDENDPDIKYRCRIATKKTCRFTSEKPCPSFAEPSMQGWQLTRNETTGEVGCDRLFDDGCNPVQCYTPIFETKEQCEQVCIAAAATSGT